MTDYRMINTTNIIILMLAALAVLVLGPSMETLLAFVGGMICGIYMGLIAVDEAHVDEKVREKVKGKEEKD